jgi:molybdate transport system regulatory protein
VNPLGGTGPTTGRSTEAEEQCIDAPTHVYRVFLVRRPRAAYDRPMRTKHHAAVSVRLRFDDDARLGPGKIALLEAIGRTGSIAAAGREMGMSYRRAWLLIDSLNRMFDAPVVDASPGGANGGGATLTALGLDLVAAYRAMEGEAVRAVERHFSSLRARMVPHAQRSA